MLLVKEKKPKKLKEKKITILPIKKEKPVLRKMVRKVEVVEVEVTKPKKIKVVKERKIAVTTTQKLKRTVNNTPRKPKAKKVVEKEVVFLPFKDDVIITDSNNKKTIKQHKLNKPSKISLKELLASPLPIITEKLYLEHWENVEGVNPTAFWNTKTNPITGF